MGFVKLAKKDWLTLANAAFGFLAIMAARDYWTWLPFAFVCFAAAFDALDGRVARATKSDAFGAQLDSLSDAVSFGAAPAFVAFKAFAGHYAGLHAIAFFAASIAFALAAVVRLARFNVQADKKHYEGLPSPLAAVSVLLACYALPAATPLWLGLGAALMLAPVKLKKPGI